MSGVRPAKDTFAYAKHMARYGHKYWVAWHDKAGNSHAEKVSYQSLKQAMLDTGTQGRFMVYGPPSGTGEYMTWGMAAIYLRNLKGELRRRGVLV